MRNTGQHEREERIWADRDRELGCLYPCRRCWYAVSDGCACLEEWQERLPFSEATAARRVRYYREYRWQQQSQSQSHSRVFQSSDAGASLRSERRKDRGFDSRLGQERAVWWRHHLDGRLRFGRQRLSFAVGFVGSRLRMNRVVARGMGVRLTL